jgi:hypothetical protein
MQLALSFQDCGKIVELRICGDHKRPLRFAFIEFFDMQGAAQVGLWAGLFVHAYRGRQAWKHAFNIDSITPPGLPTRSS